MSMKQCVTQREGWGADMAKSRKVYIVMAHKYLTNTTYVCEVCSSKKKAEEHCKYMDMLMATHETDSLYCHWVYDARVV
jgi:hypothetical protein